ncbi:aldehyde dehydrogenase 6B2 [Perilla frutescens var. hirtella]|uniref:Aldehyde dehydrogenase 6B2 n=1 Tax=Perilla frutescens var. hirtella TaxID=608512 RepID=A0AAD4JPQ8_PERFH|nr:aldehyde dehydrogenase 6B2 [Perilla frutescens var. hirtella]KAH6837742.1 aldehyde dehydrogenase 6B2 [Perilla frutescens var. hirtella]
MENKGNSIPSNGSHVGTVLECAKDKSVFPDGVLNIVHGTNDTANAICDDEDIRAVSFFGSNTISNLQYSTIPFDSY